MLLPIESRRVWPSWPRKPARWGALLLGLCGCAGWWDEVTSRDFHAKNLFSKPDPMIVLRDSTDGHRRGQALGSLREPAQHGGDQQKQDFYVDLLTEAATKDPEPLCRLGAIRALGTYKDPRAAKALEEVYLGQLRFPPEINSTIRMQALTSLEQTGNPEARHLLIRVAGSPGGGTEASMADRQQTNDERLTAIRGLARFKDDDTKITLVRIMESEKDIALRQRAYESLKTSSGKNLPNDPSAWRAALAEGKEPVAREPGVWNKLMNLTGNRDAAKEPTAPAPTPGDVPALSRTSGRQEK